MPADKHAALGIPTASPESLTPSASTVPVATVDTSKRLQHTIHYLDAAAGGNKKRPRGVDGCEIWVKIGAELPGSEKDCMFLALDRSTPYLVEYDAVDAGKTAHSMLRWQLADGSKSAWGETVSRSPGMKSLLRTHLAGIAAQVREIVLDMAFRQIVDQINYIVKRIMSESDPISNYG